MFLSLVLPNLWPILTLNPPSLQAKSCICHTCGAHLNRLHSCLYCVFFACFAKKHIHDHAKSKRHNLGKTLFSFEPFWYSLSPLTWTISNLFKVCSSSLFFSQLFVHTGYTFFCVLFLMTFKPWVDPMFPLLPVYHPLFIQLTDMCLLWLDICVHVPHSRQQPELWLALTLLCVCVKYSRIIDCSSFQDRFQMACNLHHSLKVLW